MKKRKYPCVMQHDQSDCAAATVATILSKYKKEMSIMKIREIVGTNMYGTNVYGIVSGLEKLNFTVKAVRVSLDEFTKEMTLPAVLQVKNDLGMNHFITLHKVLKNGKYLIADPANGLRKVPEAELRECFQRIAIFMVPNSNFESSNFKKISLLDTFGGLILSQKYLVGTVLLASLILTIIGIVASLYSKILMDEIIPFGLKKSLYFFVIIFAVISILQAVLSSFRQQVLLFLSRKIDIPVLLGYYDHIIHLPYSFFGSRRVGDILTRFQDAMTIKNIFTSISISLIMDVLLSGISAIILWNINANLFLILLSIVVIHIILIYVFKGSYKKINQEQMEAGSMLNSQLIESVRNIETVKSQNDERQRMDKLEKQFVHALEIGYKEGVIKNVQSTLATIASSVGGLVFMGVGALYIIEARMTIGDLLVFQTLSQYFTEPVQNLVNLQLVFQEVQVAFARLREIMELDREGDNNRISLKDFSLEKDIEFKNITFSYGSGLPILRDFNLTIVKGEKIAFVGESGAGKSTIVKLLLKFYKPTSGQLKIGEYDLVDLDYSELRQKIAYIPQNIELFSGTIVDNLRVGNELATYEDMMRVCRIVGIHDTIQRMQNGYGSFVEEGGQNFSGGEKQRLAIARALLSKSDIFIFDEATSNLDSFSEKTIQELIFDKIVGKTTIIVAHRLSTVMRCDKICVIENGAITEIGTHRELLKLNGRYAKMVNVQGGVSRSFPPSTPLSQKRMETVDTETITYTSVDRFDLEGDVTKDSDVITYVSQEGN